VRSKQSASNQNCVDPRPLDEGILFKYIPTRRINCFGSLTLLVIFAIKDSLFQTFFHIQVSKFKPVLRCLHKEGVFECVLRRIFYLKLHYIYIYIYIYHILNLYFTVKPYSKPNKKIIMRDP
jgi:hypothetical protein